MVSVWTCIFLTLGVLPGTGIAGSSGSCDDSLEELQGWFQGSWAISIPMIRQPMSRKLRGLRVHGTSLPNFSPGADALVSPVRPSDTLYLRGTLTMRLLSSCLQAVSKVWVLTWGRSCELWAMRGFVWTGWGHVYKWNRISGASRDQSETGRDKRAEANC